MAYKIKSSETHYEVTFTSTLTLRLAGVSWHHRSRGHWPLSHSAFSFAEWPPLWVVHSGTRDRGAVGNWWKLLAIFCWEVVRSEHIFLKNEVINNNKPSRTSCCSPHSPQQKYHPCWGRVKLRPQQPPSSTAKKLLISTSRQGFSLWFPVPNWNKTQVLGKMSKTKMKVLEP